MWWVRVPGWGGYGYQGWWVLGTWDPPGSLLTVLLYTPGTLLVPADTAPVHPWDPPGSLLPGTLLGTSLGPLGPSGSLATLPGDRQTSLDTLARTSLDTPHRTVSSILSTPGIQWELAGKYI